MFTVEEYTTQARLTIYSVIHSKIYKKLMDIGDCVECLKNTLGHSFKPFIQKCWANLNYNSRFFITYIYKKHIRNIYIYIYIYKKITSEKNVFLRLWP